MKIVITGATGFIGRELGRRLAEKGHELRVLTRDPKSALLTLPFPAALYAWNPGAASSEIWRALDGAEAIFHLAGEPVAEKRWTAEQKRKIHDSRVRVTEELLTAAARAASSTLSAFICASGIGYYGDTGDREVDETASPGHDFLARVCVEWEQAALEGGGAALKDCRRVALRTGVVLGRTGGALPRLVPIFQAGGGGRLGSGRQYFPWIHLDDQVGLYLHALESASLQGTINAVAPESVTQAEFARELGRALGRPAILPTPAFALKAALGEMSEALLGGQRARPARAQASGYAFGHSRLAAALQELCEPYRGGASVLEESQYLPKPRAEVFDFFSHAENLEKITPPWLRFEVKAKSTASIREGTRIDYRLKLHGVPLRWRSRIRDWNPPIAFVDTQERGPYSLWHHTHSFEELGPGTLVRDRVRYRLPAGPLGRIAAGWKVAADVGQIFAYRRKTLIELFG